MNNELKYRAILAAMQGVRRLTRLLLAKYSLREICESVSGKELQELKIQQDVISLFFAEKERINPERELEKVQKIGASIIMPGDQDYPYLLSQMSSPPLFLYRRGQGSEDLYSELQLAIVGSRSMNQYSGKVLEYIIPELVAASATIISGLAYGVDAKAHKEVLKRGGKAIAVLGNSIDMIYPYEHRHIADEILASGGAIFSEYGPGFQPPKYSFPARNRIIAGLAHGTLVVQAGERSGSLITAKQALDENREVMAVPGDVFSPQHVGSLRLLSQGAHLVTSAADILALFGHREPVSKIVQQMLPELSGEEKIIFDHIQKKARSISALSNELNIPISSIQTTLTSLEIQGLIAIQGEMASARNM